jgi:hypothetical protein
MVFHFFEGNLNEIVYVPGTPLRFPRSTSSKLQLSLARGLLRLTLRAFFSRS